MFQEFYGFTSLPAVGVAHHPDQRFVPDCRSEGTECAPDLSRPRARLRPRHRRDRFRHASRTAVRAFADFAAKFSTLIATS